MFKDIKNFLASGNGLEAISGFAMATTVFILAYKTVMNFEHYDYGILLSMAVLYFIVQEKYQVVPPHQVSKEMPTKNRKKKQKDYLRTVPANPEQSLEKLTEETNYIGSGDTPEYIHLYKYFESEEAAVCQEKALLAYSLINLEFSRDKAIDAAKICGDIDTAISYLTQKCDSCDKIFSVPEIAPMVMCSHQFCASCIKNHFAKVIRQRNILECICKICKKNLEGEENAELHLSNLCKYLESLLPVELYKTFKQEYESGRWKNKLKSNETMHHGNITDWQTHGNSSVVTRGAAARASRKSSKQFDNIYNTHQQSTESTSPAYLSSNYVTTRATNATEGNNDSWPSLGTRSKTRNTDLFKVENYHSNNSSTENHYSNNSSKENCSFCSQECFKIYNMISCEHKLCFSCVSTNFSEIIRTKDITECVCPLCNKPKLQSKEEFLKYFESFQNSFRITLNKEVQLLFENKFTVYMENIFGEDNCCNKNAKLTDQGNSNRLQRSCGHKNALDKESASSVNSLGNSLNYYLLMSETRCPRCTGFCNLTRRPDMFILCDFCETKFCGTCKAWYNNGCQKGCYYPKDFHLHHKDICVNKKIGSEKLEILLKSNNVDFITVKSEPDSCFFKEAYNCQRKTFKSELCKYHYEDYLSNLALANGIEMQSSIWTNTKKFFK